MTMDSRTYMTCGVKIDTTSGGWHKCITKMLKKIKGASYELDAEGGMAIVTGKVNPRKLIRRLAKCGKQAELSWVITGDQGTYGNGDAYMGMGAANPYYNMHANYGHGGYYPSYPHHGSYPMSNYYPQAPYNPYNYY